MSLHHILTFSSMVEVPPLMHNAEREENTYLGTARQRPLNFKHGPSKHRC